MNLAQLHRRTVEAWAAHVAAVGDAQWDGPTPCSEWSVRDLTNHVVGEERWTVPLMHGATLEQVGDRFDGDVLGDDPKAASAEAAVQAADVVDEMLPRGGKVHLSYGEEDMAEYVRQLAADHLIHGWDLAVAIGADATMDRDLVEQVAGWFADREEMYRSSGVVGPRNAATGDPQVDLLAGFGRDAGWTPRHAQ